MTKLLRLGAAALVAALIVAAAAGALDELRPDKSTLARSTFNVATTFRGLTPFQAFDVTWTAHFEDGDTYTLGMGPGKVPGSDGILTVTTFVDDFVYFNPGEPLEWVRVCLRPPRSPANTEITGPDGHPLCDNIETGDYHSGYADPYGATSLAVDVSRMVADTKRAALARART